MGDLFHYAVPDAVPDRFIDEVFATAALAPQHTFLILTKRPQRMREYFDTSTDNREHAIGRAARERSRGVHPGFVELPLPNVWLGVSVENQKWADHRIPLLLQTPAALRFVSCEPLLGPVNLEPHLPRWKTAFYNIGGRARSKPIKIRDGLDWVIVGGESGPDARPMHPDWVRSLRNQAVEAAVPLFFKQWGEWVPKDGGHGRGVPGIDPGRAAIHKWPDGQVSYQVGKKAAGNLLDGREWSEWPEG